MSKMCRNGCLTEDGYDFLMDCLSSDLGCERDEDSIANAFTRRTGYFITLDLRNEPKVEVCSEFDTQDKVINLEDLDTDYDCKVELVNRVYGTIDFLIGYVREHDDAVMYELYDDVGISHEDACEPYDEYWLPPYDNDSELYDQF